MASGEEPALRARMLGTWTRPWCPACRRPAGPDCPDSSRSKRARRSVEKRAWKRQARTGQEEE